MGRLRSRCRCWASGAWSLQRSLQGGTLQVSPLQVSPLHSRQAAIQSFTPACICSLHSVVMTDEFQAPSAGNASLYGDLIAFLCPALYCSAALARMSEQVSIADSLPSPTTGTSTSVLHEGAQQAEQAADKQPHQSQQAAQDLQANKPLSKQSGKLAADAQSFLRGAAKAVTHGSTEAALSSKITEKHVKIFVAELPPKYNTDLLDAAIGLGASGSLTQVRYALIIQQTLAHIREIANSTRN